MLCIRSSHSLLNYLDIFVNQGIGQHCLATAGTSLKPSLPIVIPVFLKIMEKSKRPLSICSTLSWPKKHCGSSLSLDGLVVSMQVALTKVQVGVKPSFLLLGVLESSNACDTCKVRCWPSIHKRDGGHQ